MVDPQPAGASPVGRWSSHDSTGDLRRVELLGTPVQLLLEGIEHHDAVMRELQLLSVMTTPQHLSPRLAALTEAFGRRSFSQAARPEAVVERAAAEGRDAVDLAYDLAPSVGQAARQLEELLREVDLCCEAGDLITLPRSAAVRAFSEWYLQQVVDQLAGDPPRRWS